MRYSYNEPDLFVIAKVAAPKTYRTYNPSSLEDFISYLEEDIADALADSGFVCVDENRIQQQAEKTASWWWTNVFQKDRLPQNQKEALKKTAVEGLIQLKNFKACIVDTETTGLGSQRPSGST